MRRHALITAGTKGIGRQVTEHFLQKGYSVTVNYRSEDESVASLRAKWIHLKERLQFIQGDVTDEKAVDALVRSAKQRFGRIDCCLNNAGPFVFERKKIVDYSEEEWTYLLNGNLTSVFRLAKQVVPIMREQRFGRWITYGFQEADRAPGWMYRGPFAAVKTGLVSFTRTLALEESEYGITANMVCPGVIVGDMKEASIAQAEAEEESNTPFGRSATGEDVARLIAFLCEENSVMISGSVIDVTGGVDTIHQFRFRAQ
ncbi:SDR family oxidoreductase [Pullulanibacillus sp. KACC 23026]|uniref:SDR family oxidoreductase n=1 Tax=Pullulanibacillus sp. KACC 23026 TaxID=3028315 RepID=UPI0023B18041|nr:SDR family oxidoreductase [Pullulanibacillus sp. KACC 23026]WEG13885.1 SDR family oxidoreductase [Pullulanibacillus sp. KACC 23026]